MAWRRRVPQIVALSVMVGLSGCVQYVPEPPGPYYKKLSDLVHFPDFYPGLGTLYVQPTTMPYGPYQGYDRLGRLVNTIYMVPLTALNAHLATDKLQSSPLPVDHVEIYFNSGH